ncbi:MAG: twin-arginine translocase TatA/TatE family subunit [Candidatus Sericytochromatia bacterium]|nr:twin-arginine translocase TatA/TatE family subunit [Candidatus Sericytochromatia bacterium]
MFGLGGPELLVIGGIVLLLFGPAKIPALAGSIGKGIREFKKGVKEVEASVHAADAPAEVAPAPVASVTK